MQATHVAALVADDDWPAGQLLHVFVTLSTYVPGEQSVQKPSNDFAHDCRSPAGHCAQAMQLAPLVWFWYLPIGQSVHSPPFDASTNRPGAQSIQ